MSALEIVLAVIDILSGVAMVVLFLVQEGNDRGMGVVSGTTTTDSYYSKTKGRSLEERLKFATKICAIIFAVTSIILYLSITKGI
ncbi:MAG: preprotein translocase subunit SecG [Clostridiales bacterium]|nr:preprotein translocase subunit SecG [Clostridiales bacterium]MBR6484760.1 preprotein translocase subunit SecG [Clostridiales bacterium]